jgi:hypothetical protein
MIWQKKPANEDWTFLQRRQSLRSSAVSQSSASCFICRFICRKAALVGCVRNSSLACTGLALHRIDFVSCQHWLLHRGEARSFAGRADMFFDLRRHVDLSGPPQFAKHPRFFGAGYMKVINGIRSYTGPPRLGVSFIT